MNLYALYVQGTLARDWPRYRALGLRDVFLGSWEPGFGDAVVKAEAAGLRVHGWISPAHVIREQRPDLCISIDGYLWPDWRLLAVREMACDIVADMVYRYDVAPHVDYLRGRWEKLASGNVPDWFTSETITETVQMIREATEGYHLSVTGVGYVSGQDGNGQDWPLWGATGLVDVVCPMLYCGEKWTHYFDNWREKCGDVDWLQPALAFNIDGEAPPFTVSEFEYRVAEALAVYPGCAFFDAALLDAHPHQAGVEVILREYGEEDNVDVIDHLLAAEEMLRAAGLEAEANQVADLIASLRARDDVLDAQADVIEDD